MDGSSTDETEALLTEQKGGQRRTTKELLHSILLMYDQARDNPFADLASSEELKRPRWANFGLQFDEWKRKKIAIYHTLEYLTNPSSEKFIVTTLPYTHADVSRAGNVDAAKLTLKESNWMKRYYWCNIDHMNVSIRLDTKTKSTVRTGSWSVENRVDITTDYQEDKHNLYHITLPTTSPTEHRNIVTVWKNKDEVYEICCFDPNGHTERSAQKKLEYLDQILNLRTTSRIRSTSEDKVPQALNFLLTKWGTVLPWPEEFRTGTHAFSMLEVELSGDTKYKVFLNTNVFSKISTSDNGGNCLWACLWLTTAFVCNKPDRLVDIVEGAMKLRSDAKFENAATVKRMKITDRSDSVLESMILVLGKGQISALPPFFLYYCIGMMITDVKAIKTVRNLFNTIIHTEPSERKKYIDDKFIPDIVNFRDNIKLRTFRKDFIQWYWDVTSRKYLKNTTQHIVFEDEDEDEDDQLVVRAAGRADVGAASLEKPPEPPQLPAKKKPKLEPKLDYHMRLQLSRLRI